MKLDFNAVMPRRVYYGENAVQNLEAELKERRCKAAVFSDKGIYSTGLLSEILCMIERAGCEAELFLDIPAEPDYRQAQKVIDEFQNSGAETIIAVGGGSVMDVAKLASVTNREIKVKDLLDNPLLGEKFYKTIMIPTTAGTGSEATPNSIVLVPEKEVKVGIVNKNMVSDIVILDGSFIKSLPQKIAAATGIDALTHCIECFTSNKANAYSNLFALEGLKLIMKNIVPACMDENAAEEKNKMLLGAFYGGIAIAVSGTTAVHALSYPLGGKYHIAHGVSNAILLVPVMRFNKDRCLKEFEIIYDAFHEEKNADMDKKADWVIETLEHLVKELKIPSSLKEFHVSGKDLEDLAEEGIQVRRLLDNNKKEVTLEDAKEIYRQIL